MRWYVKTIIIPIAIVVGFMITIVAIPVVGFRYTAWKIDQILSNVPESGLMERTRNLPEVKAFIEKYGMTYPSVDRGFDIRVVYNKSECELTGQYCGVAHPSAAYLDIGINLDTGFPDYSQFWCDGNSSPWYSVGDEALIQHIKNC